jgi:hypothetical protein
MEKEQRNRLQKATQDARKLLEEEFRSQLLQTYDIDVDKVHWANEPGAHLLAEQRLIREKLIAWIKHKEAQINDRKEALLLALREMAFTALNRFVALKLMEARELVRPCVSGGLESAGFLEFTAVAQGLLAKQESSYRLYLETIFEDVSRELRALFDPRDPASLLWPKRAALLELLDILNRPELAELWSEDETLGWVYQYFNGDAERKKMREESSAPRNSRELAVRNQFFTPRYVVEFLTDNTLGRIWHEMRQGNTGLKDHCRYLVRRPNEIWLQPGEEPPAQPNTEEDLSQEELLRQPVHIPHRHLKDPREIRMLDPACGSMHFGLYAFDLYLAIYEEAWEIAQGTEEQAKQGEAFAPFVAYAADFTSKAAFLLEVPRLILQHNIHGVDIDPRATQIARLTLWLRAQRAWQEQLAEVAARPPITRSNVVCAEPMPGERELLADFVDQQFSEAERGLVQQLLEAIFDKMQLAGEAGSLLKIEEEIRDAIDQARREWRKLGVQQWDLFSSAELAELGQVGSSLNADLQNLTKDFWVNIEDRIYAALRDYAELTESGSDIQRRLFAEDAAQGFAFIDICRKRYDVAVMNPPFGEMPGGAKNYLFRSYNDSKYDIYAAFVIRSLWLLESNAQLGALTSRTGFFLTTLQAWREQFITITPLRTFVDLGVGVLDSAAVEACCFTACSNGAANLAAFINCIGQEEKAARLRRALDEETFVLAELSSFSAIPTTPFAYWAPSEIRALFAELGSLKHHGFRVRQGLGSSDNFRFLKSWWEVPEHRVGVNSRWVSYAKGGGYQPFWGDQDLLVLWENDGKEIKQFSAQLYGTWSKQITNVDYYSRPGLTYSSRGSEFSPRTLPKDSAFDTKGSCIFDVDGPDCSDRLLRLLVVTQSRIFRSLLNMCIARSGDLARSYTEALVEKMPMPNLARIPDVAMEHVTSLIKVNLAAERLLEETHSFAIPYIKGQSLRAAAEHIDRLLREAGAIYAKNVQALDDAVMCSYGIAAHLDLATASGSVPQQTFPFSEQLQAFSNSFAPHLLSWLVGCVFGRWDIRYASGEQAEPELPDPFAALPICPPGQLQNANGLPACPEEVPTEYPVHIPWDGILVDDPNHPLDLEHRVRGVIEIIWSSKEQPTTAVAIEHEACDILGINALRDWFRRPTNFFADHLKRYSKSRRQAPIYWQLSAGNGIYSAWLYYHRFTQDTLYRVLRDFVEPRIQQAERDQFELESQIALSGDAAVRLQEAQTLLQDLRILKSELDLVAPLWNPNLDDGVIINHTILWRITPYTPWQKKCKECWDKLVKGDYDWAHLAFHLWPERVIRSCTTDRSLAIAHGLEERLWQETSNGNWLPRQLGEADLQALIAEHSNPAVKNALERFLAAPPPVAPTRTRASRSSRASGSSAPRRPRGTTAVVDAEATRQVLLALTAAPTDGLAKAAIADLIGVEANALTAVIKQLKESGQIDQLGERRGARYVLSEQGRAAVEQEEAG